MTQDLILNKPSSGPESGTSSTAVNLAGCDPKNVAVVIAAHGDRGQGPENERNQAGITHSEHLSAESIFRSVSFGVLKGKPDLETALSEAIAAQPQAIVIYPFFMADGYFVNTVLPQRLAQIDLAVPHLILTPLGLDPRLVPLIIEQAEKAAIDAGIAEKQGRLLLVGHGSKYGPASANATRHALQLIEQSLPNVFAETDVAFLEEKPFLNDQLFSSPRPTVVSGFFNGDGLHAGEDVPNTIASTKTGALYTGPIGADPGVTILIKNAICNAL